MAGSTTSADVGAIVLAAGEGRRFGGAKQVALLDGRPLLDHVIGAVDAVPAIDRVVVMLGAHADAIRDQVDLRGVVAVDCPDWAEGQAASLRAGVAALGDVRRAVVLLGDMPRVTGQVIAGAIDQHAGCDVVRTAHGGRPGHPVVLGPRALAGVPALTGDTGARALFASLRVREWEAGHLFDAADIDTPDQLRALSERGRSVLGRALLRRGLPLLLLLRDRHVRCAVHDRLANAGIRPAATHVAQLVEIGGVEDAAQFPLAVHHRDGSHDLAWLAVAALRHVVIQPRLLHRVQILAHGGRQPLDRGDPVRLLDGRHGDATRVEGLAVLV
jgi:CTP:molybdopterin cytidylyltransferase MocA